MANNSDLTSLLKLLFNSGCLIQINNDDFLLLFNKDDYSHNNKNIKTLITQNSCKFNHLVYFSPFFSSPLDVCYKFNNFKYLNKQELLHILNEFSNDTVSNHNLKSSLYWSEPNFNDFNKSFQTIQNWISDNKAQKVVPTVYAKSNWKPSDLIDKINLLKSAINNCATQQKVYALFSNSGGMVGATPEILFELKNKTLKTMAIAGTLQKDKDNQPEDLLKNLKDVEEHNIVVDFLKTKLGQYGNVKTKGPYVVELPTLYHLKTDIEVENITLSPQELMNLLHPTPALGISSETMSWVDIKQLPYQNERQCYGSALGVAISEDHFLALVCIRNIEWNLNYSYISSGCGIIKESEVSQEWKELQNKRNSVKKLLNLDLQISKNTENLDLNFLDPKQISILN